MLLLGSWGLVVPKCNNSSSDSVCVFSQTSLKLNSKVFQSFLSVRTVFLGGVAGLLYSMLLCSVINGIYFIGSIPLFAGYPLTK